MVDSTSAQTNVPPPAQRAVLVLDDDRQFLELFVEMAAACCGDAWKVHTAVNSAQALALLQEHPVDLAVVDIRLPVVDGLQFIRLLNQRHPQLRKAVLTAASDHAKRDECLALGAELFLEKPKDRQEYDTLFALLRGLFERPVEKGFRGLLRSVGLDDVLQMECLSRKSSVLEVSNNRLEGRIYIEQGAVVHAVAGTLKGEPAFYQLFALEGGDFRLLPFEPPPERTIEGQWEYLLMETARLRDERAVLRTLAAEGQGQAEIAEVGAVEGGEPVPKVRLPPRRLEEIVIASDQNNVQFQERCVNADKRLRLIAQLRPRIQMLTQLVRVGAFQQLEAQAELERTVIILGSTQSLLARVTRVENPGTPAPS